MNKVSEFIQSKYQIHALEKVIEAKDLQIEMRDKEIEKLKGEVDHVRSTLRTWMQRFNVPREAGRRVLGDPEKGEMDRESVEGWRDREEVPVATTA